MGTWSIGGDNLLYAAPAPGGGALVEFRTPTHAQRLWLAVAHPSLDLPGTARVNDPAGGEAGPASPLVELSGIGPVAWSAAEVRIGTSLAYDRAARRWRSTA